MTAQGEGGGTDLSGRLMLGEAGEEILPESPYRDVLCDGRWIGPHGIGRFASEVFRCLPGARILEGGKEFLLTPADPLWIARQIMRYRPRLYFTPGFNPPLKSPCPFIVTVHDLIHLKVPEESGVKKWAYYNVLLKPALIRAKRILTVSDFSRREILEWTGLAPGQVQVVGCGVGAAFTPEGPRWDPGHPYFLHVGNHKPHKNLPLLLSAFSRSKAGQSLRLVLTGTPAPELQETIRKRGLTDRVVFLGNVGEPDLPALYRGARALVFPSKYEGFGLPVLEALACKVPVIASRIPPVEEVAGKTVLLLSPDDEEAWRESLEQAGEDPDFGKERALSGFSRSRLFSWEKVGERVGEIVRSDLT